MFKTMIIESMELIESEFPGMQDEVLFEKVYELICKNQESFLEMNEVDRFDYLVDGILFAA